MSTAMFGVHCRYGFSSVRLKSLSDAGAVFGPVGYEVNLLYIAALVALGAGRRQPALRRRLDTPQTGGFARAMRRG